MYKCVFFLHVGIFLLFRPRVFARALGSGARRESARTPRRKCGPWPRSATRALEVQSREKWRVTMGRYSEHVEPSRACEPIYRLKCFYGCACCPEFCRRLALVTCSPRARVLECSSAPHAHARVLVLECSFFGVLARALVRPMSDDPKLTKLSFFGFFAFGSVFCCKIIRQGQFPPLAPNLALVCSTPSWTRQHSTSASTIKNAYPQQQHQQLECVACCSACSVFPPA